MESSGLEKLLVTGVGGFLGLWCAKKALESGKYEVYGTIRDNTDEKKVSAIRKALGEHGSDLHVRSLELNNEETCEAALEGIDYVLHTASPFIMESPKDENEMINPAVNGTLYVLRAAVKHGVKKVVTTGSAANILDYTENNTVVDETSDKDVSESKIPYTKSKYLAEEALWKFHKEMPDHKTELTTILPGFLTGPAMDKSGASSHLIIQRIMTGKMSSIPKTYFPWTDIRDAAAAHLLAVEKGKDGNRYAAVGGTHYFPDIGKHLAEEFKPLGYKVGDSSMYYLTIWLASFISADYKYYKDTWGLNCTIKNDKAVRELGCEFTTLKQSLVDMGYSLIENGYVEDLRK